MSEISKLYKNANIKICKRKQGFTLKDCTDRDCKECGYYDVPPFTAEKQIELIKWCLDNYRGYIFDSIETEWFEEQLCAFISNIWQSLTEEEKQQIKEILE